VKPRPEAERERDEADVLRCRVPKFSA